MPIIAGRASAAYGAGFAAITAPPYLGPFGAYDALASVTLSSAASSVSFMGIPIEYNHLQIRVTQFNTTTATTQLRINGDTSSNYSRHYLYGGGSSATGSSGASNQTSTGVLYNESSTHAAVAIIDILDYKSVTKNKTVRSLSGFDANGSGYLFFYTGAWFNSSTEIGYLTFSPDGGTFNTNSSFALYGVK